MVARTVRYVWIFACLGGLPALSAPAAELVLFEAPDCVWCAAWNAEIGGIYPKTAEAQVAPLRRVDIHDERPVDLTEIRGIIYTPTFVLTEGGVEVGRITGYSGEDSFWGLLGIELKKLYGDANTVTGLSRPAAPPPYEQGVGD